MNLYWIADLSVCALGEKLLPGGHRAARWVGVVLTLGGVVLGARM